MSFEESRIERLKKSLYSRNENVVPKEKRTPVQPISGDELNVPKSWGAPPSFALSPEGGPVKRNNRFFNKFLLISVIFFFIALGVATLSFSAE